MTITFYQNPIDPSHLNCLWYGGAIFGINYKCYDFIVGAYGDVRAALFDNDGNELCYVKDKQNSGRFYDEMRSFIKDDAELLKLLTGKDRDRYLWLDDNNWLEVLIDTPDGDTYDLGWVLDTDNILEAITEVVAGMDEAIENIRKHN